MSSSTRSYRQSMESGNNMKGMKCKCKYATVSSKTKCPRCGREMNPAEWPDEGKVLSFTELRTIPEGFENPYDMTLVVIENGGPKVICWTTDKPKIGDLVAVSEWKGKYLCTLKARPIDKDSKSN